MSLTDVAATLAEIPPLVKLVSAGKNRPLSERDCLAAHMEKTVAKFPNHTAIIFEGRSVTWSELNALANRYAAKYKELGLKRGDSVSVMMENRIEFVANVVALNKLGVASALINTNLTGRPLTHCLSITNSRMCIFGEERLEAIEEVRNEPDVSGMEQFLFIPDEGARTCPSWATDLTGVTEGEDPGNPAETQENTLGDLALYIFTSGTTGLPKAAVLTNRRYLLTAVLSHRGGLRCDERDCIYLCLPLYHGTGLFLGVGGALTSGASMFIRRKFSATNFLPEVREHGVTHFIYIGELCRYLLSTSEQDDDHATPLTTMMGNGLRPDVWHEFKRRFGIKRISEFYGASEGNVAFVNLLNKDCTVGMTAMPIALVKYDVQADEMVHDENGFCIKVAKGEPGLLLGKVTDKTPFEGYSSKEASESKILRNVLEEGDAWFNTGDLMKTIDVGFTLGLPHYQFVDRVGDTFRWKSENVSTNEVGEIINGHPQVDMCNIYGVEVPGADGRAGMAALVLEEGTASLDLNSFSQHVNTELPPYARPVFLRILPAMDTTGTFKMVKGELRDERYDPDKVSDQLYVMKPGSQSYEPLDDEFARQVLDGKGGY
jgi:citronellyl-CoA synthetase